MLPTDEQVWHGRGHTVQRQVVQERAGVLQVAEHYSPAFQNRIFSLRFFHICSQLQNLIVLHQEKHSNQILPPRKTFKPNFTPKKTNNGKIVLPKFLPQPANFYMVISVTFLNPGDKNVPTITLLRFVPNDRPKLQIFPQKGIRVEVYPTSVSLWFWKIVIIIITITTTIIIIIIIIIIMLIIITEIKVVPPTCLPIWPPAGSQRDLPLRGSS